MNSKEIQTLIKGMYVVITPAANNPQTLEIAQNILTNHLGDKITEKDILVARDEMSNQKMIDNIKELSSVGVEKFRNILNDLKGSLQNSKSDAYCIELDKVIINKKTSFFKTPNLNKLLKAEKSMGW